MKGHKRYLCKEHCEYFIVLATSMEDAHQKALLWGGVAIRELSDDE